MASVYETLGFTDADRQGWYVEVYKALNQEYISDAIDYLVSKYKANPTELAMVMWTFTHTFRDLDTIKAKKRIQPGKAIRIITDDPLVLDFLTQFVKSMEDGEK